MPIAFPQGQKPHKRSPERMLSGERLCVGKK